MLSRFGRLNVCPRCLNLSSFPCQVAPSNFSLIYIYIFFLLRTEGTELQNTSELDGGVTVTTSVMCCC